MSLFPIHHVDLPSALDLLSEYLGDEDGLLREYASDDQFCRLGWDGGQGLAPIGSIWSVEGILLYALVRWLSPQILIELGTSAGASTTHIASAFEANTTGLVFTSIDNHSILSPGYECGGLIPSELGGWVDLQIDHGLAYITRQRRADFILDDMNHSPQAVALIWNKAIEILTPGGLVISHDAAHPLYTEGVLGGIQSALRAHEQPDPLVLLIHPSDTGLAIWRKPGARIDAE